LNPSVAHRAPLHWMLLPTLSLLALGGCSSEAEPQTGALNARGSEIEVDFSCSHLGQACSVEACNVGERRLRNVLVRLVQVDTEETQIEEELGDLGPGDCKETDSIDVLDSDEFNGMATCNGARSIEFRAGASGRGPDGVVSDTDDGDSCLEVALTCANPCNFTCGDPPTDCPPGDGACTPNGRGCDSDSECCSESCVPCTGEDCTDDQICACKGEGEDCDFDGECCTDNCDEGECAAPEDEPGFPVDTGPCGNCSCAFDEDGNQKTCNPFAGLDSVYCPHDCGTCEAGQPPEPPALECMPDCVDQGEPCSVAADCCSGTCDFVEDVCE
jgi:hypothetical protein